MRTLLRITPDVKAANEGVSNGTLPQIIKATMDRLQPEAAYFFPDKGERSCLMVFDLKDPSDIPQIAEPFFTHLNARVEFIPVMNVEELQRGLAKAMQSEFAVAQ